MPQDPRTSQHHWPTRRKLAAAALVLTVFAGAALVFLPIGWQINRFIVRLYYWLVGTFGWSPFSIDQWAVVLNVLLFLVPAFLLGFVWPRVRWWAWASLGFTVSAMVEVVQYLFLPRDASLVDWMANGLGATVGALVAAYLTPPPSSLREEPSEGPS